MKTSSRHFLFLFLSLLFFILLIGGEKLFAHLPKASSESFSKRQTGISKNHGVLLKPENALASRFPGCRIKRHSHRLTKKERQNLKQKAQVSFVSSRYIYYEIHCSGKSPFLAVQDRHRVRTKRETLLIIINPGKAVEAIDVLDFHEPRDYLAPARWLRLLKGKASKDAISPGNDLAAISGATLTSHAVSSAVRRALAFSEIVQISVKKPN